MRRQRIAFSVSALLLALAGGQALAGPPAPPISGVVRHAEAPVSGVLVIFFDENESPCGLSVPLELAPQAQAYVPAVLRKLADAFEKGVELSPVQEETPK